jgi:hypothetical protein
MLCFMRRFSHWRLLALTLLVVSSFYSYAQTPQALTGKVTTSTGDPMAGVTIAVKNSTVSTSTNSDGNFRISVPSNGILVFSYVGYAQQEIPVNNQQTIAVSLVAAQNSMEEVVVVGYGTQKRGNVTSAIVSVGAEEIRSRPVANALQAIQGKAAGVDVTSTERPGTIGSIRIRGERSISGDNGPLYVVDGVPLNFGGIEAVNPNDIESIDILKDASATAVYGSGIQ